MADKTIIVEQIGSPIRRPADQRQTLIGLGLNKIRRRATLKDTPAGARHDRQGRSTSSASSTRAETPIQDTGPSP